MNRPIRRFLFLFLVVVLISTFGASPRSTAACGGFFCSTTPINQNAERIIFAVDSAHQKITAVVGINYVGDAKDFSWIVPVPSRPKLDVADPQTLNSLDFGTSVQFTEPPDYCNRLFPTLVGYGGGGGGGGAEQGQVGPYDYAILSSNDPNEVITWLKSHNYRVTPAMEPIIMQYVKEGLYFLAMRLNQDYDVGDIKPIMMTYSEDHPMIPIRLTAVAAVDDMPILTWIFGDAQYIPQNYAHPVRDFSSFRAPATVENIDGDPGSQMFFQPINQYPGVLDDIQTLYNGQAFVTEYAAPTAKLRDLLDSQGAPQDDLLDSLMQKYKYVTRLRAQMSANQMTVDPTFIPDPKASDVSNVVDLGQSVDPLAYWGCSSRDGLRDAFMSQLPPVHTRIDELQWDVAHPAGWVLSKFVMYDNPVWAFAPRPVDASTINAFLNGQDTVPMLVAIKTNNWYPDNYYDDLNTTFAFVAALSSDRSLANPIPLPDSILERLSVNARYEPHGSYNDSVSGLLFGILAPTKNWHENVNLYGAMLDYATTYQYYADGTFGNTLFLRGDVNYDSPVLAIPYPESWTARINGDGDVLITPVSTTGKESLPFIQLTPTQRFLTAAEKDAAATIPPDRAIQWATKYYGLSAPLKLPDYCTTFYPVVFQKNGLTGIVVASKDFIVAVAGPGDPGSEALSRAVMKAVSAAYETVPCS